MDEIQRYRSLLILCSILWFMGWLTHWSNKNISIQRQTAISFVINLLLKPGLRSTSTDIRGTILQLIAITTMVGALFVKYGLNIENPALFAYKYLLGFGLIIGTIVLFFTQIRQGKTRL